MSGFSEYLVRFIQTIAHTESFQHKMRNGKLFKNKKNGFWIWGDEAGYKESEGSYKQGIPEGLWTETKIEKVIMSTEF